MSCWGDVAKLGLFAIFALLLGQEPEPALEKILERMEEEAGSYRGSTFDLRNSRIRGSPWGPVTDSAVAVARDGTIRVHSDPDRDMILVPGELTIVEEDPRWRLGGGFIRRRAERLRPGTPCRLDAFLRPAPSYQYLDPGNVVFHRLSPRAALALEPDVRLSVRRRSPGDPYVLVSRPPAPARPTTPGSEEGFRIASKKFYVHARDFRLERMETRMVWGGRTEYMLIWELEGWAEGRPGRLSGYIELTGQESYYVRADYEAASQKKEPALDGAALRAPAGEFFALSARSGEVEARLRGSPDDAELNYSRALEILQTRGAQHDLGGATGEQIIRALEKAAEGSWTSTPVRNLLNAHAQRKDLAALEALAVRIEKDARRAPDMAFDAAEAFLQLGKFDKALGLLGGLEGLPKTRVAELRIAAFLGLGQADKAAAEFIALADPAWAERLAGLASLLPEEARKSLPREDLLKRLDEAIAADPKSAGLHAARLRALAQGEEYDRIPAAVRAALESALGEEVERAAYELVRAALQRAGPRLALEEEERADPWIPRLVEALGAGKDQAAASVLRGAALKGAGRREEAAKEFTAAVEALEKAAPSVRMAAVAGDLAVDLESLGNDALMERAGRTHLRAVAALGKGFPGSSFSGRGPIQLFAQVCLRRGAHAELFRELRGLFSGSGGGEPVMLIFNWGMDDIRAFLKACRVEALKGGGNVEDFKWIAQSVTHAERYGYMRMADFDLTELLERGREIAPKDLDILQLLAGRYAAAGQTALATRTCNEILGALAAGAKCERPWPRDRARLVMAEQQQRRGNTAAALAAAKEIDPAAADLTSAELSRASQLCEELGRLDAAVAFLDRLAEEGYRPHHRMAALQLRRRDWVEAMRHVNRALERGYDGDLEGGAQTAYLGAGRPGPAKPERPEEIKARIYREAGENWFLDRFFASKLQGMTPEERREAEGHYRRLLEDDIAVRDEALGLLRRLGPKCAPVLRAGLELANVSDRTRVRALLSEWAEPR